MKYILVNSCETIQHQYESDNINDVIREFKGRVAYDIILLKAFDVLDYNKIYEKYHIYKIDRSPEMRNYIILDTLTYDIEENDFKSESRIQPKNSTVKNSQEHIKIFDVMCKKDKNENAGDNDTPKINVVTNTSKNASVNTTLDASPHEPYDKVKCKPFPNRMMLSDEMEDYENIIGSDSEEMDNEFEYCSDVESKMESSDEPSDSDIEFPTDDETISPETKDFIDDQELNDFKKKIDALKNEHRQKVKHIKHMEKKVSKRKNNLAEEICELTTDVKQEKYEKEKLEKHKKKFEADRIAYNRIKKDIGDNKILESKLPPFYINIYNILKQMDLNGELETDKAFEIFMTEYKKFVESQENIKEEDDTYGIL